MFAVPTLNEILLKIITLVHILFVLFIVLTPFFNSTYFLLLHAIVVPFVVIHWVLNDNTCCLTMMEKYLKKQIYGQVDENDCITCKIIEPVYDFKKNYSTFSKIIYTITISLWLFGVSKLYCKYKAGEITKYQDLFIV